MSEFEVGGYVYDSNQKKVIEITRVKKTSYGPLCVTWRDVFTGKYQFTTFGFVWNQTGFPKFWCYLTPLEVLALAASDD